MERHNQHVIIHKVRQEIHLNITGKTQGNQLLLQTHPHFHECAENPTFASSHLDKQLWGLCPFANTSSASQQVWPRSPKTRKDLRSFFLPVNLINVEPRHSVSASPMFSPVQSNRFRRFEALDFNLSSILSSGARHKQRVTRSATAICRMITANTSFNCSVNRNKSCNTTYCQW